MTTQRQTALEKYQNRQYEAALAAIQPLITARQAQAADYFLAGLCSLYQANPDDPAAVNYFLNARAADPNKFADEIAWYLSLAYVRLHQPEKAIAELRKITAGNTSRNKDQAAELLRVLQK